MTQIQNPLTEKLNRMTRELIWIVIFTARQNPANLNEIKMNLIVKFANLAGKSYITLWYWYINYECDKCDYQAWPGNVKVRVRRRYSLKLWIEAFRLNFNFKGFDIEFGFAFGLD